MVKRHFLQLAREGDAQAIATLINRNLQPKGIFAIVKYEVGYLQICLEAVQVPRQAIMMNFIHEGIKRLEVEGIRLVRVYGRRKGKANFSWHESFIPNENPPSLAQIDASLENLKKLAKQGDSEAIAVLLDRELAHKQWHTTVEFKEDCLKINIYGKKEAPESQAAVTLCSRLIAKIRSPYFFTRVEIRGYKQEPELLLWLDSFENDDQDIQSKGTMPAKTTLGSHKKTNPNNTMLLSKLKTWF